MTRPDLLATLLILGVALLALLVGYAVGRWHGHEDRQRTAPPSGSAR